MCPFVRCDPLPLSFPLFFPTAVAPNVPKTAHEQKHKAAADVSAAAFPELDVLTDAAVPEDYNSDVLPGGGSSSSVEPGLTEWSPSGSSDPPEAYLSHFDMTGVHDGYDFLALFFARTISTTIMHCTDLTHHPPLLLLRPSWIHAERAPTLASFVQTKSR